MPKRLSTRKQVACFVFVGYQLARAAKQETKERLVRVCEDVRARLKSIARRSTGRPEVKRIALLSI